MRPLRWHSLALGDHTGAVPAGQWRAYRRSCRANDRCLTGELPRNVAQPVSPFNINLQRQRGLKQMGDDLLRSLSWHSEKLLRKRGEFATVLWLVQFADSRKELFETECKAPDHASIEEALQELTKQMREEFSNVEIAKFAVAYLARKRSPTLPEETYPVAIVIEQHDRCSSHWRAARELIWDSTDRPMLGALGPVQPAISSRYANILAVSEFV